MTDASTPADFASCRDAKAKKARVNAAYYILDGHAAVSADAHAWHRWLETADRVVEQASLSADTTVSTVFIGFDEDLNPANPAIFETEISNTGSETNKGVDAADGFRRRYATWEEAVTGHRAIVALLTAIQKHKRLRPPIQNPLGASARAEEIGELAVDFILAATAMIAGLKAEAEAAGDPNESPANDARALATVTDPAFSMLSSMPLPNRYPTCRPASYRSEGNCWPGRWSDRGAVSPEQAGQFGQGFAAPRARRVAGRRDRHPFHPPVEPQHVAGAVALNPGDAGAFLADREAAGIVVAIGSLDQRPIGHADPAAARVAGRHCQLRVNVAHHPQLRAVLAADHHAHAPFLDSESAMWNK